MNTMDLSDFEAARPLLTSILLVVGTLWIFVACVGLLRLPDLLCRSHAMGKAMTLGITLVLLAVALQLGAEKAGLKVVLAILFQFLTIPVAGHLLSLLAYRKNVPRWRHRPMDRQERSIENPKS
ncbi:MAG: monovalent cation/H(+) antiporter subunit G [Verrucomicrobiota bacterium]